MRYFLLDRIDELKKLTYAVGTKCISLSEDCFEHHFPGQPVYPGALLLECMAQLGGALLEISLRDELDYQPRCAMSSAKVKFRKFVGPGDTLTLRADIASRRDSSALVRVVASRSGERVCDSEILYILLRIDDPQLQASRAEFLSILTRATRFVPP